MTDNLKLPESFEWQTKTLVKGELDASSVYIHIRRGCALAVADDLILNTNEIRTLLKAMEVVEATIKARNQPN